ncbi:MAG: aromatic amino acid lyase, partial [Alphaproteobacteria bacterium]|nr:aromatic amino acid lyase [Alphaproteobacteria bacterium]
RVAQGGGAVALAEAARARVRAARAVVERFAAGQRPIYGLNTGLGANLKHRLTPDQITAFQTQFVVGRAIGVGEPLPAATVRAAMLARANAMALGGAGVSPAVLDLLLALLNRGVTPVVPRWGSIAAGDLGLLAHIALVAIGRGEAEYQGRVMPGEAALAAAGLDAAVLGPKDGLALCNANALSAGMAALALARARRVLDLSERAAALSFEGYAANPAIFDARLAEARAAAGQIAAAARFRDLVAGSSLHDPGAARSIQDALSFRCLSQVHGPAADALGRAVAACELELNSAAENPLVLVEDAEMLSTGNFHVAALALAGDALAMALAMVAAMAVGRVVKLMQAELTGLERYLTPVGGAAAGFVPAQKTAVALYGEIRHAANPASLDQFAVSETVEDHSAQAPLVYAKLDRQLDALERLVALEMLAAAQAVDLRKPARLGRGTAALHTAIRAAVPMLEEDREIGPDVERVVAAVCRSGGG